MNKHRRRKAKARRREAKVLKAIAHAGTVLGRAWARQADEMTIACLPPSPFCSCHACQGIHCFVWHPGHSHTDPPSTRPFRGRI
jgi:hypothetical protein